MDERSLGLNSKSIPTSCFFEVASCIEFLELIVWLTPFESIVPISCKSPVWHDSEGCEAQHKEQMGDSVVNYESLHNWWERPADGKGPENSSAVNGSEHAVVWKPPRSDEVWHWWLVNNDWEWRSFIRTVDSLVTYNFPDCTEWTEWSSWWSLTCYDPAWSFLRHYLILKII